MRHPVTPAFSPLPAILLRLAHLDEGWAVLILGAALLVFLGCRVIEDLKGDRPKHALACGLILIGAIPFWLNLIITGKYYFVIPIQSGIGEGEWFAFLGSYLGVAGTVIAGALAYWQSEVNRRQDQELVDNKTQLREQKKEIGTLQQKLIRNRARPSVKWGDGTAEDKKLPLNGALCLLIDFGDAVSVGGKEVGIERFFSSVYSHQEYFACLDAGFDRSSLRLEVEIDNRETRGSRTYALHYRICSLREGKRLQLCFPYVEEYEKGAEEAL